MTIQRRNDSLAFDKESVRTKDLNGHLHVSLTPISKANICPYLGKEIPRWQELGLDSGKVYMMLRHPEELRKSAHTFDGKPLLDTHIPVSAWDHPKGKVVGSVGTDGMFDGKYLKNSLAIWTSDAIEDIESNRKRETSCSYSYDADMTPGSKDGVRFDGIMRNIQGNHVALVEVGRAGHDVLVEDSINPHIEVKMAQEELKAALAQLAKDQGLSLKYLAKLANDEEKEELKKNTEDEDETEEEKAARLKKEAAKDEKESASEAEREKKDGEVKKAMDAAIKLSVDEAEARIKAQHREMSEAVGVVRPWVGDMIAMDSAEQVYKAALDFKQIDHKDIHPSALKAVVLAHMSAEKKPVFAHDAKIINDIQTAFPNVARIKRA